MPLLCKHRRRDKRRIGRYGATEVSLQAVALSPSIAYSVNDRLSLGAGVSVLYTLFEEEIAINQGAAPDG